MYVITGATGRTGSIAAETLLDAGKKVRVVVRDPAKAARLAARGAEVFVADLTDGQALRRAAQGAQGVFLISPPDVGATDFIGERKRLTQAQVDTLAAAKAGHVVLLSSIGSQHATGTGLILSTHNAEQQLRAAGVPATFVRAGYFVENWAAVVPAVKSDGVLPTFMAPDTRIPAVGTGDIGRALARALLDGPRGIRVIELAGPADVSPRDVAAAFSRLLGRDVQVAPTPLDAVVPMFTSFGMSPNVAGLFREMYQALADGKLRPEAGGEQVRGTIPLEQSLRNLLG